MWAAARLVDTDLSLFLSFLELYRTDVAERRMSSSRVVEPRDVVEHVGALSRTTRLQSPATGLLAWKRAQPGQVGNQAALSVATSAEIGLVTPSRLAACLIALPEFAHAPESAGLSGRIACVHAPA